VYGLALNLPPLLLWPYQIGRSAQCRKRTFIGIYLPLNYKKSMNIYTKLAQKGYLSAVDGLGDLYAKGHGVPQDYFKAFEYYQ